MTTHPIDTETAATLPASAALVTESALPGPDRGELLISRDSGVYGSACKVHVYVQGEEIVALRQGEQIRVYPPLGETIVGGRFQGGMCSGGGSKQTTVTLKPEICTKVRIGYLVDELVVEPSAF